MRTLASMGGSFAVLMASSLAGHTVPVLDVLICAAAIIASVLMLELYDRILGP